MSQLYWHHKIVVNSSLNHDGKEIMRIESLLYQYHFTEVLRYVAERHYKKYPKSFYDYLDVRTAELLKQGKTIDLSK